MRIAVYEVIVYALLWLMDVLRLNKKLVRYPYSSATNLLSTYLCLELANIVLHIEKAGKWMSLLPLVVLYVPINYKTENHLRLLLRVFFDSLSAGGKGTL